MARICSRYSCHEVGTVKTPMGLRCPRHAAPLMFPIQWPPDRPDGDHPIDVPWEFVAPHDDQCRRNHGGQSMARISERGGFVPSELVAVLEDRDWFRMDERRAMERVNLLLAEWRRSASEVPIGLGAQASSPPVHPTMTLTVEVPKDKAAALAEFIKSIGGQVL